MNKKQKGRGETKTGNTKISQGYKIDGEWEEEGVFNLTRRDETKPSSQHTKTHRHRRYRGTNTPPLHTNI
ncbi:hypothetical protein E2C01_082693 [Portunus trituberculatus]|uniref:Uncharacterized protein n=1 Tax=Portunus trituberculatus TaxID=210409 RepID=A0A5B7J2F4_PORTR|nr:hypothetical protein [Portunus trituberculatus]